MKLASTTHRVFITLALILMSACGPATAKSTASGQTVVTPDGQLKIRHKSSDELYSDSGDVDALTSSMLHDSALKRKIQDYQESRAVDCLSPRAGQIHWMCINGPTCAFSLDITCTPRVTGDAAVDYILRFAVHGSIDKSTNTYTLQLNEDWAAIRYKITRQ